MVHDPRFGVLGVNVKDWCSVAPTNIERKPVPTSAKEKERVLAVIEDWRVAMAAGDAERAISLWDPSYAQPVFMAPDYSHALPDLAAIRQAYAEQTQGMAGSQWTLSDVVADVLGEAAFVHCYVSIEAEFEGNAISFRDNNTFVLRNVEGQWKIILYHEGVSRDAPKEVRQMLFGD